METSWTASAAASRLALPSRWPLPLSVRVRSTVMPWAANQARARSKKATQLSVLSTAANSP